ncbi:FtsX-like permease family protein [Paenibacillus sp. YPG26]|uniref:FtsX-like permease family protein n=1 Tax=Paenibacillus sp. YPG26 TaxID=2878915 RepID=UPI00203AD9E6|nr:FtsX-like permease family protein [Paenibacillus sp. YPG26]USB33579.1 hypothetical protein LDO05_01765 [Paenibacillus sp. YPG26]
MVNLAVKLLLARKKRLIIMGICFAVVISSVLAIFSSTEIIKSNIKQNAFSQYGEFSGVLLDRKNDSSKASYGQFVLTGSINLPETNRKASIGWVSSKFVELGHVSLKSGRWPTSEHEVAIEAHYLNLINPNWKIGKAHGVKVHGKTQNLKLVGVVENYSARWSIDGGKVQFPNLFIFQRFSEKASHFLIPYDNEKSPDENYGTAYNIVNNNDKQGFVNERLIYNGLKDLDALTKISMSLQTVILLISLLGLPTLISFFNANRNFNYAVLRSLGSTSRHLYQITVYQTTFIFLVGTLLSLPLFLLFQYLITIGTTNGSTIFSGLTAGSLIWFFVIYILIILSSILSVLTQRSKSMKQNFDTVISHSNTLLNDLVDNVRNFHIKQLLRQLFLYPKRTLLSLLTMTISIVVVLFALAFSKEAAGIWTTDIDYYLSSQENVYSKKIEHHNVLISQDITYSPQEVAKLQSVKGIIGIDKEPSMTDVMPVIKRSYATPFILSWAQKFEVDQQSGYEDDIILPNVRFVLKPIDELRRYLPQERDDQGIPPVVLYSPGIRPDEKNALVGKTISLSKIVLDETGKTVNHSWDFQIANVIVGPFEEHYEDVTLKRDEITFVLDEKYAMSKGITKGYKDLSVYTSNHLSKEESQNIYDQVYSLAATTPGGLFQHVPDLISDSSRMANIINRVGNFTFYIAIFLSITCIYIVLNGKYQIHKRYWGIYRSLGMRVKGVYTYLLLEIHVYFVLSALISAGLYTIFLTLNRLSYPTKDYIAILLAILLVVYVLLLAASLYMKKTISRDSIALLLKVEE